MRWKTYLAAFSSIGLLQAAQAVDWYVATNGTGGGTSWADATSNLQGAINAASSATFDVVWVSNGVYETGGTKVGSLTNRIVINKAITVRSFNNDPTNTIIVGAGAALSAAAIRCVYISAGSLIGFTLTNGYTMATGSDDTYGGGVYCPSTTTPVISNCIIICNTSGTGGGAFYGTLRNCTLTRNTSYRAGGTYNANLYYCTLTGNAAVGVGGSEPRGGGAYGGSLNFCALISNTAYGIGGAFSYGGGMAEGTLNYCTLTGNSAGSYGGGTYNCSLSNCVLTGNSCSQTGGGASANAAKTANNCTFTGNWAGGGGGAYGMTLYNCTLNGNQAIGGYAYGGGASGCTLYNCTVTGNSAWPVQWFGYGGGVYNCTLYNCIVYFNNAMTSDPNYYGTVSFSQSCTTPLASGTGNTASNPMFITNGSGYGTSHVAGNYRLLENSPCINAGTNFTWMTDGSVTSKDLDGRVRLRYSVVDMGAYEHIRVGTIYSVH